MSSRCMSLLPRTTLHSDSEQFLYIFMGFCVYVPLPPLRGQHTVLCHPRWLPTSGLTEFAVCWGGAGFEPRTTDLQSGAQFHLPSVFFLLAFFLVALVLFVPQNNTCRNFPPTPGGFPVYKLQGKLLI
jgi:hypothetical protein